MTIMLTECNCDMPWFAYYDWLRDQGWSEEDIVDFELLPIIEVSFPVYEYTRSERAGCGPLQDEYHDQSLISFPEIAYDYTNIAHYGAGSGIWESNFNNPDFMSQLAGLYRPDMYGYF